MSSKLDFGIAKFAMLAIVVGLVIGTTSMINPVAADKDNAREGLDRADENVHENAPENDVTYHEGQCQGGHSSTVLDSLGGCDADIITDPGNSDDNRQDE
jgi:hypothetical protein